jgi:hypothetical protein
MPYIFKKISFRAEKTKVAWSTQWSWIVKQLKLELIIFSIQIYLFLSKYQSTPYFYNLLRVDHNLKMGIIKQVTLLKFKDKNWLSHEI